MTTYLLEDKEESSSHIYLTISGPKKESFIGIDKSTGELQVICKNAAHSVFRGVGKFFSDFEEAENNYKSSEMKGILQAARLYLTV